MKFILTASKDYAKSHFYRLIPEMRTHTENYLILCVDEVRKLFHVKTTTIEIEVSTTFRCESGWVRVYVGSLYGDIDIWGEKIHLLIMTRIWLREMNLLDRNLWIKVSDCV